MRDQAEDARLLAIAAAVSEGAEVDWADAERTAGTERGQRILRGLRVIANVARVHRSEHASAELTAFSAGVEPVGLPPPSGALADWAHLHILKELGKGAFGTVYRAWDPRLEREVALKLLATPAGPRGVPAPAGRWPSSSGARRAGRPDLGPDGKQESSPASTPDSRPGSRPTGGAGSTPISGGPTPASAVPRLGDRRDSATGPSATTLLREARLLARVRHPNVVIVYGAEEIDGRIGIWMESLRGHTLDELLRAGGRLGPHEAALLGLALCRALAAVHAAGLVHRDVKARNVMREDGGRIVLMDFGAGSDLTSSRGEAIGPAGTPLYMAPEILDGARPTPAADIYSLGVLLYHLVTLTYPITGKTKGEIQDAHQRGERRRLRDARPDLPEPFVKAVDRALADDPAKRHESAGAFEEALFGALGGTADAGSQQQASASPPPAPQSWRRRWGWPVGAVAAALASALMVGVWTASRQAPAAEPPPRARFDLFGPRGQAIEAIALSPDGTHLAFVAQGQLWVRALDALEPRPLPGTGGANQPFWSPDGASVGFFAGTKLKRVGLSGEEPRTLCDARRPRGGTWSPRGLILFADALGSRLSQVSAEGGEPTVLRTPDELHGDRELNWPVFLPDGARYLYVVRSADPARSGLFAASLDGGDPRRLIDAASNVTYAAGALVYVRRGTMLARPFDPRALDLTGPPASIVDRVDVDAFDNGLAEFSTSTAGEIVYRGGSHPDRELRWFDRQGRQVGVVTTGGGGGTATTAGQVGEYRDFALSPDGGRLAYDQLDSHSGRRDVWVLDLATGATIRLTFDPDDDGTPVWSPDGRSLIFASNRGGRFALYRRAADGSGSEERLFDAQAVPFDWSSDGGSLVYEVFDQSTGTDLFLLPMRQPGTTPRVGEAQAFLRTEFMEREPMFSPDGRWIAYSSSESSQRQVYLQTRPASGRRWQVSPSYGREPRWRADGRELFYIGPDDTLMSVGVSVVDGAPKFETPRALFKLRITGADVRQHYAVSPDGQRILVNTLIDGAQPAPVTVLLNGLPRGR